METDILTQCSGRSAALHLRSHSSLCSLRCALLSNLSHWSEYSISYAGVLSAFILVILANIVLYYFVVNQTQHWVYGENSLMENLQAAVAVIAGLTALLLPKQGNHFLKVVGYAFAFLGLAIFLREVDVERLPYDIPALLLWLGHGLGRNLMLVIVLALVLWQATPLIKTIKNNFLEMIPTPAGLLMGSSFILLLLSDVFEKNIIGGANHVFYEELMELDAYFLFLFAALFIRTSFERFGKNTISQKPSIEYDIDSIQQLA